MFELSLLLVVNVGLIGAVIDYWKKIKLDSFFLSLGKYIIILLVGWIGFSILIGLFLAFQDLENSKVFSCQLLLGDVIVVLRFFAAGLVLTFLLTWVPNRFSKRAQQKK